MIDKRHFRSVLGKYPTGVCVITATDKAGSKHGMVVGSFTSISLDPPLVGFFPTKSSRSWQAIAGVGRFCVNVLVSSQLEHAQRIASRIDDKFADISLRSSPSGQPVLNEANAWIDCEVERVNDIGDHVLVVGRVEALDENPDNGASPLIFFKGKYHEITQIAE